MKTQFDPQPVLSKLSECISAGRFSAYFGGVTMRMEDDGSISVCAPTRSGISNLDKVYGSEIRAAIKHLRPDVSEVHFRCVAQSSDAHSTALGALVQAVVKADFKDAQKGELPARRPAASARGSRAELLNSELPLSPLFRLSMFVNGVCNRMASSAAQTIVESPGSVYNLLYIYGGTGLGKTHLLQGIAWALREADPKLRILYTSCETFANAFISSLQSKNVDTFRAMFRSCDVLLVDDVHFLAGKIKTQQELLFTIQFLRNSGKQIVFSSSLNPTEVAKADPRLADVFRSGLVVKIDAPEFELRVQMLHALAKRRNWTIPDPVARLLATHVEKNVGELEGALCKLIALSRGTAREISEALAMEALQILGHMRSGPLSLDDILEAAAKFYNIKPDEIRAQKRNAEIVHARHVALYLSKHLTSKSVADLGRFYGSRDHTTVLYALRKIQNDLKRDEPLKIELQHIRQALGR